MARNPYRMPRIMSVVGTRPEVIKMTPVIKALQAESDVEHIVCSTAQHRDMLDHVLLTFGLAPDIDLDLMQPGQSLPALTARVLTAMTTVLSEVRPDWVLVQGDTTTVLGTALAAFYCDVKIGHVEAGLRSFDMRQPFPEELNRALTSR